MKDINVLRETKNNIIVFGDLMELGESFTEKCKSHLAHHLDKYWRNIISSRIIVSKNSGRYKVEIITKIARKKEFAARGESHTLDKALLMSVDRSAKQLRRYKRGLNK